MSFQYSKLADSLYDRSSEQLLFSDEDVVQDQIGKRSELIRTQRDFHAGLWEYIKGHWLAISLVAGNVLLFLSTLGMLLQWNTALCYEKNTSSYSPVFDRVPIYKSEVHNNFTIYWPDDKPSIFQQPPSPEVDEAWDRITSTESIALNAEEVRRIGYDPAATWPAPESDFGEGVYYGVLDVFHQLHCLNNLRKTTWPEYYGDMRKKMIHTPIDWDHHLTHCTYVLMRSITCHADLEVLVGQKFAGWPGLNLNFGSTKMCRNFDEILKWKEDNTIRQTGPWTEYPDRPIIEQSPEGVLTPYGNHLGIEDWAESQRISLAIPSDLEWQPSKSHNSEKS